jgi:hypothetical protein
MSLRSPAHYDLADKCKIALERAARLQAVYHFWFHPSDPTEMLNDEFRRVLAHVAREREKGIVWTATMADVIAYCEHRARVELDVERQSDSVTVRLTDRTDAWKYGHSELTLLFKKSDQPRSARAFVGEGHPVEDRALVVSRCPDGMLAVTLPAETTRLELSF